MLLCKNCHSATAGWKSAEVLAVGRPNVKEPGDAATRAIAIAAKMSTPALAMRVIKKKRFPFNNEELSRDFIYLCLMCAFGTKLSAACPVIFM